MNGSEKRITTCSRAIEVLFLLIGGYDDDDDVSRGGWFMISRAFDLFAHNNIIVTSWLILPISFHSIAGLLPVDWIHRSLE